MNKLFALLAVLLLCVQSWAGCVRQWNTASYISGGVGTTPSMTAQGTCGSPCVCSNPTPPFYSSVRDAYFMECTFSPSGVCGQSGWQGATWQVSTSGCNLRCDNKCEADSVKNGGFILECQYDVQQNKYYRWICPSDLKCSSCGQQFYNDQTQCQQAFCADNPEAEGCEQEHDTTLFACSDNASGNGALYRLSCKALGGQVTSCNGKTDVDVVADGTLVRQMMGSCAQNGFGTGIVGGATSDSASVPPSANADCFAVTGSTCHLRDKASGNTFRCACDGSCNVALRNLMAGDGSCTNPYPQPDDTIHVGSSESTPSSSGGGSPSSSEGSTDPTSSEGGGSQSSSSLYDPWSPLLEDIKANTQGTNEFLSGIRNNTETANELLRAIANKDWKPTINVAAPVVNVAGDTNIVNVSVDVQGDTATAPAKIYNFMKDTTGLQGYADQFTAKKEEWSGFADSVKNSVAGFLDTIADEDTSWAKHGSDIDSMVSATGTNFRAYMDTIENMPFNDTLNRWVGMIVNNGKISGSGSNDCPSLLTRHHILTIGQVSVDVGSLGGQLCTPIAGLNVTLWAIARAFLRFVVAFGCMVWIYCEVVGVKTTGEDD